MLASSLSAIVGARWVKVRRPELAPYDADGLPGYRATPSLAVLPGTKDELIAVVCELARQGVPWVPRGAGTGLSGGALADDVVLIGLNRLTRIIEVDPVNRLARVEPGVVNAKLSRETTRYGLQYAPDPSSQTVCTIGGNVAENAGGPHCLKYGVTMNHVVECEVLLPDGTITRLGGAYREADGYDLLGAFVGSEGCFGIATEVTVRLVPLPDAVHTLLADFSSVNDAAHAVSRIVATGIVPAALEMMDNATIRCVEASIYAAGYPVDAAAILLCEVDGVPDGLDDDVALIRDACMTSGGRHGAPRPRARGAGRRRTTHETARRARRHRRHRCAPRSARVQRVPRRRRQPAPEHSVQRRRCRRKRARARGDVGDHARLRSRRRHHHRRTRRGARQVAVHGLALRRRVARRDVPRAKRLRSRSARQPWQGGAGTCLS